MDLEFLRELNHLADVERGFFLRLYPYLLDAKPIGFLPLNNRELADLFKKDYSYICKRMAALVSHGILKVNAEKQMYCPLIIRVMVRSAYGRTQRDVPKLQKESGETPTV